MGIWDIIDLIDSNANLVDIESGKEEEYVIPVGGVKEGLGNKFIVFWNINALSFKNYDFYVRKDCISHTYRD